jgi:hypothetical protein
MAAREVFAERPSSSIMTGTGMMIGPTETFDERRDH